MNYKLTKLPKHTFQFDITLPWATLQKEYDIAFAVLQNKLEVEGFRKGKAPKEIAEKHLKRDEVYEQAIQTLIPRIYQELLQKEGLKPITQPKVELIKAKEKEDWEIRITLATHPTIHLGDYKKKLKEAKSKGKKDDIWLPGKDKEQKEPSEEEKKQKQLNEALALILKEISCEVPDILVESELNHRLTQIVDDVQKIGLTMESYLKSKNLTMEEVKKRYRREIEETYKLEFILSAIADEEKIEVKDEDIEKIFQTIQNPEEREKAKQNAYFYASMLRKQKTLDFLTSL